MNNPNQDKGETNKPAKKNVAVTISHSPYGEQMAQEVIDAVLALSLYASDLTVVFMGDGIFQLLREQQSDLIARKSIEKQLQAFSLYDLDKLYVCQQSLDERNIKLDDIKHPVSALDNKDLCKLLHEQDSLLAF